jgi:hypothetical protein
MMTGPAATTLLRLPVYFGYYLIEVAAASAVRRVSSGIAFLLFPNFVVCETPKTPTHHPRPAQRGSTPEKQRRRHARLKKSIIRLSQAVFKLKKNYLKFEI